jgi:ribonuclease P protein component
MPENTGNKTPDLGFPKAMHLRKRSDFDRVFVNKRSQADRMLVVYGMSNGRDVSRLGLVVSKKVGKAHQRNRWKRIIREVFRLEQHTLPEPLDLVVIPRQGVEPDFKLIRRSFCKLARKLIAKNQQPNAS